MASGWASDDRDIVERELLAALQETQREYAVAPSAERQMAKQRLLAALAGFSDHIVHGRLTR